MSANFAIALWGTSILTIAVLISALAVACAKRREERDPLPGIDFDKDREARRRFIETGAT